jgi:hypothetical protein
MPVVGTAGRAAMRRKIQELVVIFSMDIRRQKAPPDDTCTVFGLE